MSRGLDNFNSRYVYRVLRPNEDHTSDLTCCAPRSRRTVDEHVATGLKDPSRFISTTSSRERALKWLDTANEKSSWRYNNSRKIIVRIDVDLIKSKYPELADTAYDLTKDRNRHHFLKTIKQIKFSAAYNEVVFKDMIPREAVNVEYIKGIGTVRDTKAQPPSLTTVNPKSIQTTQPVYYKPSVADRSMAVTKLPDSARALGTQTSYYTVKTPSTNYDVIQQNYSPSVLSHNKPPVIDEMEFSMANQRLYNLANRRAGLSAERTHSTNSHLQNYDSSHLVLPPATYHNKLPLPDGFDDQLPFELPQDLLPYQTQFSQLSTEKTESKNTDFIYPTNSSGVLPRTTAKPVAPPRVMRERLYLDKSVRSLAEIRPSVSDHTLKVSESSFPEKIELDEVPNCKNETHDDASSFKTLIRRLCCCF